MPLCGLFFLSLTQILKLVDPLVLLCKTSDSLLFLVSVTESCTVLRHFLNEAVMIRIAIQIYDSGNLIIIYLHSSEVLIKTRVSLLYEYTQI